jgi:hypothetical protein
MPSKVLNLCSGCKQDFSGVTVFDSHQVWVGGRYPVKCKDPVKMGLVRDGQGRWSSGRTVSIDGTNYVPAAERPAHEFERTCTVCGSIFQRPRGRGRPPTKCEDCR